MVFVLQVLDDPHEDGLHMGRDSFISPAAITFMCQYKVGESFNSDYLPPSLRTGDKRVFTFSFTFTSVIVSTCL